MKKKKLKSCLVNLQINQLFSYGKKNLFKVENRLIKTCQIKNFDSKKRKMNRQKLGRRKPRTRKNSN